MGDIRSRLTSLSLSLPVFAIVGLTIGCGDNTRASAIVATGGAGGAATGGAGGMATGGAGGTATG
ncbi:MAG TPA: hypothetical protein VHO06_21620, partial [Polyangia bacterium]|nr:hypothetical protein [Polyangia bacterium]